MTGDVGLIPFNVIPLNDTEFAAHVALVARSWTVSPGDDSAIFAITSVDELESTVRVVGIR
jgi:hypothetical protein